MTRYFMRDTPLCQLEQQMMTPPNFKARGHGRYSPGFQYSSEDTECPYCINFRRNQPCPLKLCICLDERIAACALNLNEFVRDCFFPEAGVQLLARLERNFTCCSISFFLNECHRERWQHWRERYYRMSGRNLAALFLLTAYEDIWRRMIWKFDARGFDFQSVQLSGIQPELYSVYQAAKAISTGSHNITLADLAFPELVTDEAFHLIVCTLLLAKYGDAILNFEGKYPAILQEETMTSAIKKRNAKQVTTHITEAQKILRRLSGWTETKQIEQQVLGLLNMLLNNPERIQVVSPHPKSENVELQRQLDAVLSCQPIDEDAAQELIHSIASVQYSAIDADEYESIRLRRIFAQHPVMRELDAKLLKTTVSAIRVYSDKSIAIRLKNNQIIGVNHNERQSTQSHYDPCESGKHSTAGCPAAAASRRLLPGIYR